MINAAKTCSTAQFTSDSWNFNCLLGGLFEQVLLFQIQGKEGANCLLYLNYLQAAKNYIFPSLSDLAPASQLTEEQKQQILQSLKSMENKPLLCSGAVSQTIKYLSDTKVYAVNSKILYDGLQAGKTITEIQQKNPGLDFNLEINSDGLRCVYK